VALDQVPDGRCDASLLPLAIAETNLGVDDVPHGYHLLARGKPATAVTGYLLVLLPVFLGSALATQSLASAACLAVLASLGHVLGDLLVVGLQLRAVDDGVGAVRDDADADVLSTGVDADGDGLCLWVVYLVFQADDPWYSGDEVGFALVQEALGMSVSKGWHEGCAVLV